MAGIVPAKGNIFGKFLPARFIFAILGSIGLAIIYGIKDNYSLIFETLDNFPYDDSFWYRPQVRYVYLSLGSLVSQLPAAYFAHKFSAKWVMFFAVAINVVCTLLTPIIAHFGYISFMMLRIIEGITLGATFPALHCMIASWSPPNQRTVISTIINISYLYGGDASEFLRKLLRKFEWETIHYIFGGLSCIWLLLWLILVQDNPNKQRFISQREREMITTSLSKGEENAYSYSPVPWKRILTSVPFWAIFFTHSLFICGMYLFNIALVNQIFRSRFSFEWHDITACIFSIILAIFLDVFRAKQKSSTTTARKIATGISTLIPAISALILCLITRESLIAEIVLGIGGVTISANFSGFLCNHIDIAPNYAGILGAITNTVATIPRIVLPYAANSFEMTDDGTTAWFVSMGVAIACFIVVFFIYVIFGSGEEQPWNNSNSPSSRIEAGTIKATSLYPEFKQFAK